MFVAELQSFPDDAHDVLLGRVERAELAEPRDRFEISVVAYDVVHGFFYLFITYLQVEFPRYIHNTLIIVNLNADKPSYYSVSVPKLVTTNRHAYERRFGGNGFAD